MFDWCRAVIERLIPYEVAATDGDEEKLRALERRMAAIEAQVAQRRYVRDVERERERRRQGEA